jgi:3-hydroxyacyl-[acyl-carrier-protein] dehydratase
MPDESSASLPAPASVLPHRPPFLFLDEVTLLEPGARAAGAWTLTGDEWFFPGHFPGRPTLPGVHMLEAIAQLGAYAVLTDERYADRLPLFGGVDKARFRRQVVPGDRLELSIELVRLGARGGRGHGTAAVGGELACEADLLFVLA